MNVSREAGKGSVPRPFSISQDEYEKRWDSIFHRDLKQEKTVNDYQDILSTEDCILGIFETDNKNESR